MIYRKLIIIVLCIMILITGCVANKVTSNVDNNNIDMKAAIDRYIANLDMVQAMYYDRGNIHVALFQNTNRYGILIYDKLENSITSNIHPKNDEPYQVFYSSYNTSRFGVVCINNKKIRDKGYITKLRFKGYGGTYIETENKDFNIMQMYTANDYVNKDEEFTIIDVKVEDKNEIELTEKAYDNSQILKTNKDLKALEVLYISDGYDRDKPIIIDDNKKIYIKDREKVNYTETCSGIILNIGEMLYEFSFFSQTLPELNPSKDKMAFINEYGFEIIGDVYILDTSTNSIKPVTRFIDISTKDKKNELYDSTAKQVEWLDDENLLIIVGYAYGTVSQGGDVYILNIKTKEMSKVLEAEEKTEYLNIVKDDEQLNIKVKRWIDDNYDKYELYDSKILIKDLLDK